MNRATPIFLVLFLTCQAFSLISSEAAARESYADIAPILDSAEKFFISLKDGKYGTAWDLLSERSRSTIITDIYKSSKENGEALEKEDIENDFENRGTVFHIYWDAFLKGFDPDMVLKESRWDMGPIDKDETEIIILHKRSEFPAKLKMFRENGTWKVGFSESFGVKRF